MWRLSPTKRQFSSHPFYVNCTPSSVSQHASISWNNTRGVLVFCWPKITDILSLKSTFWWRKVPQVWSRRNLPAHCLSNSCILSCNARSEVRSPISYFAASYIFLILRIFFISNPKFIQKLIKKHFKSTSTLFKSNLINGKTFGRKWHYFLISVNTRQKCGNFFALNLPMGERTDPANFFGQTISSRRSGHAVVGVVWLTAGRGLSLPSRGQFMESFKHNFLLSLKSLPCVSKITDQIVEWG